MRDYHWKALRHIVANGDDRNLRSKSWQGVLHALYTAGLIERRVSDWAWIPTPKGREQFGIGIIHLAKVAPSTSAGDFIEGLLRDQPRTKDEIREISIERGIYEAASAGRAVHLTLVNMARSGRIKEFPDGRYGLPGEEGPGSDEPAGATDANSGGVAERPNAPDS